MLHHRVMLEVRQDFLAVILGYVVGDQHKVQLAFVVVQLLAANEQNPRPQDEREQAFN
jgi:septum formation topological specificity factor MinE